MAEHVAEYFCRFAASSIFSSVYGWPALEPGSPHILRIKNMVTRITSVGTPGASLVDFFPVMKHLPAWMAKWKREAEGYYRADSAMFEKLYSEAEERLVRLLFLYFNLTSILILRIFH